MERNTLSAPNNYPGYWFLSNIKVEVIAKYALFDKYCMLEVFF
jgi:hypothetical protein